MLCSILRPPPSRARIATPPLPADACRLHESNGALVARIGRGSPPTSPGSPRGAPMAKRRPLSGRGAAARIVVCRISGQRRVRGEGRCARTARRDLWRRLSWRQHSSSALGAARRSPDEVPARSPAEGGVRSPLQADTAWCSSGAPGVSLYQPVSALLPRRRRACGSYSAATSRRRRWPRRLIAPAQRR